MSRKERCRKFQGQSTALISPRSITRFDNARSRITQVDPASLILRKGNPRLHPPEQIKKLAASITEFGFVMPALADSHNHIISGNARVLAALQLGLPSIPVIYIEHLTEKEVRLYALADNRLAEHAVWDKELLTIELKDLSFETSFDLTVTGFETAELDLIIGGAASDNVEETLPIDWSVPAISRPGDLFNVGRHRVLCADALSTTSYPALLQGHRAQMCFIDPPYNTPIIGHVSRGGKIRHPEFAQAHGEMTDAQFTEFLGTAGERISVICQDGAVIFVCMDWRHAYELQSALAPIFGRPLNQCVWVKSNGGMGSLYRSQHELVFVFKKGEAPHINNIQLGKFGRSRTNVWNYAGANSFGKARDEALAMHPTVKPVAMIADAIMDCSHRGGIILDTFAGSGTTLIAAEQTGRAGYGIEIDPHYVDTILKRFEKTYGLKAVHAETGLELEDLAAHRGQHAPPVLEPAVRKPGQSKKVR